MSQLPAGPTVSRAEFLNLFAAVFLPMFMAAADHAAQSLPQLVAARVLQGLGGGGLMTLSQALIGELVPPRERVRFQGYFALVFTSASIGGPVIGGLVVSNWSWRWLFLANVLFSLPASSPRSRH
ncbi:MAG TPA: MFS transporter [Burkholderiales bacterium]|nr:MFS transporter [Burkholderiales bacterium]